MSSDLVQTLDMVNPMSNLYQQTTALIVPEFIRLPKSGTRCPWTSLSRSAINELILPANAPVKSVVLRRRGAKRGQRLIHLQSLIDFLNAQLPADAGDAKFCDPDHPELPGLSAAELAALIPSSPRLHLLDQRTISSLPPQAPRQANQTQKPNRTPELKHEH